MAGFIKLTAGQRNPVAIAAGVLLAFSFVFGGASRDNLLRVTLIELASLPLLILASSVLLRRDFAGHRFVLAIAGLLAALPLMQLIPIPPQWGLSLPGREQLSQALAVAGVDPGWSTLSLTPDLTWQAFLALVPPIAMFVAVLTLNDRQQSGLVLVCLVAGILAVGLCAVQIATSSPMFYLWSWSDPGLATGFFANRNHMAALCTSTLPFAAVLAASGLRAGLGGRLMVWLGLSYLALMVIALAAIQSRAGVGIGLASLFASLAAVWVGIDRRLDRRFWVTGLVSAGALMAVSIFGLEKATSRFDVPDLTEGRADHWPYVIQAAQAHLPVGSGIGSFNAVYRSVEPLHQLDATYFNAAHNEYLQIWLEAGWLGVALLVAFLLWFVQRSMSAWLAGAEAASNFQRAASIAVGAILLHSVVDYPLRTETMMVFFAICCGILEFAGPPRRELRTA